MPFGLGIWELAILAGLLVLLFGSKGALGAAKGLGRGVREMQDAVRDVDPRRILDPAKDAPPPASKRPTQGARIVEAERAVPVAPTPRPATSAPPPTGGRSDGDGDPQPGPSD